MKEELRMKLLITFIIASVINVILQTIKSIVTVKCGKWLSAITNAVVFGFYTWVVVLMVCDLSLWAKITITAITNFIGVWIVKYVEEKARKDRLWLVKTTIPNEMSNDMKEGLIIADIPYSCIQLKDYVVFDTYCATQKETQMVTELCQAAGGKMFATENKL